MVQAIHKAIEIFESERIPYCLIGGLAVSLYTQPRSTQDVDFMLLLPRKESKSLMERLNHEGHQAHLKEADLVDPVGDVLHFLIKDDATGQVVPFDAIISKYTYQKDMIDRSAKAEFLGKATPVIQKEDLICLKLIAGSPKDLLDAVNVANDNKDTLDIEAIHDTCEAMGMRRTALEDAKQRLQVVFSDMNRKGE